MKLTLPQLRRKLCFFAGLFTKERKINLSNAAVIIDLSGKHLVAIINDSVNSGMRRAFVTPNAED